MRCGKYEIKLSKAQKCYTAKYTNNETGEGAVITTTTNAAMLSALQSQLALDGMDMSDLREYLSGL